MTDLADRRYSVILNGDVAAELEAEAKDEGTETNDHLATILTRHISPRLAQKRPDIAERLAAEERIKAMAAAISRHLAKTNGVQPDHTVQVFREIRLHHADDYRRATACETGFEGGSPLKHSLNATLGAISKRAAGAKVRKDAQGIPEKIRNIRGEFCVSATVLEPDCDGET